MKACPATLNSSPPDQTGRIIFLDYLRIFAFTTVLIGHTYYGYVEAYIQDQSHQYALRSMLSLLLPIFYAGGAGVIVFFLVSGYIITHVLQTEQTGTFIIKRIFRIYPLYMFALLSEETLSIIAKGSTYSSMYFQYCFQHPYQFLQRVTEVLPQFLLVGDFFGAPYTLGGVEWTLRLEILFYFFMAILHSLNVMHKHKKTFPYLLGASIFLLMLLPPFPFWNFYTTGGLTIYAPFFLLGAIFYLTEIKQTSRFYLLAFIALVMYQYFTAMARYQPRWIGSHFVLLAVLVFTIMWVLRKYMAKTTLIVFLSELTYATYLFHAWLYDYLGNLVLAYSISTKYVDIQALVLLLGVCVLAVRYIEKPSIKYGNHLVKKLTRSS